MSAAPATASATGNTNVCPQCGASFRCGMEGGDKQCWCARLPAFLPVPTASGADLSEANCLCPDCLKARLDRLDR